MMKKNQNLANFNQIKEKWHQNEVGMYPSVASIVWKPNTMDEFFVQLESRIEKDMKDGRRIRVHILLKAKSPTKDDFMLFYKRCREAHAKASHYVLTSGDIKKDMEQGMWVSNEFKVFLFDNSYDPSGLYLSN